MPQQSRTPIGHASAVCNAQPLDVLRTRMQADVAMGLNRQAWASGQLLLQQELVSLSPPPARLCAAITVSQPGHNLPETAWLLAGNGSCVMALQDTTVLCPKTCQGLHQQLWVIGVQLGPLPSVYVSVQDGNLGSH